MIAAPSANTSGRPSPTLASHVYEDMQGRIPLILDGGAVGIGIESTIIDMSVHFLQMLLLALAEFLLFLRFFQ